MKSWSEEAQAPRENREASIRRACEARTAPAMVPPCLDPQEVGLAELIEPFGDYE